jgi:SAM-dependent methyltransferase
MDAILVELETFHTQVPVNDAKHLNEVEFRLGYPGGVSNVGVIEFDRLLKLYKKRYGEPKQTVLLTLIDGSATIRLVGIDKIKSYLLTGQPDADALYYTKKKHTFSFSDHPLRISFGTETPTEPFTLGTKICFRYAQRFSFQVTPDCTADFTVVRQATAPSIKIAGVLDAKYPENYEIELEFQKYDPMKMNEPLSYLLKNYYGGISIAAGLSDLTAALNGYILLCNTVLRPEPYLSHVDTCTPILWHGKDGKYFAKDIAAKYYYDIVPDISEIFQPEHLNRVDSMNVVVTDKADGRRALLFTWSGKLYLLYKNTLKLNRMIQTVLTIIPTGTVSALAEGSLYDGEYITIDSAAFYLCFDVLSSGELRGKDVPFSARLTHLEKAICNSPHIKPEGLNVCHKTFTSMNKFQKVLNLQTHPDGHLMRVMDTPQITYMLDGLIFQNTTGRYPVPAKGEKWSGTLKWKPPGEVTMDFKIVSKTLVKGTILGEAPELSYWQVSLAYGQHNTICRYKGYVLLDRNGVPRVNEDQSAISIGDIVECRLKEHEPPYWILMRLRRDKNAPNGEQTYVSNMSAIQHQVSLADFSLNKKTTEKPNPMYVVNKINRRISNQHIYNYAQRVKNGSLFEFAVGAAQSSSAWKFAGLKEIIGIDIDVSKVAESDAFLKRGNSKVQTNYYTWDITEPLEKHPVISTITSKYDLAVCNFAIHYAFRSEASLAAFCKNVTRYLKKGGYFIGTYMSQGEIMKLPQKIETIPGYIYSNDGTMVKVKTTDNDTVWSIKKMSSQSDIYGQSIQVDIFERPLSDEYFIDLTERNTQLAFQKHGLTYIAEPFSGTVLEQFKINRVDLNPFEQRWIDIHKPFVFRYDEAPTAPPILPTIPKLKLKRKFPV